MERKNIFRLCHVCRTLNEAEEEILRCICCGKGFLPLNYFEKIRDRAQKAVQAGHPIDDWSLLSLNPLNGLIVFW